MALLMVTLFAIFAPGFLFTEDVTRKADAVILFVGPGDEDRLNEAKQLIKEGYARYLLIPFSGELFEADNAGGLVRLTGDHPHEKLFHRTRIAENYKKHYENTHIEALEAKRMMDELGVRSAMLVSSGYHMRRIRLIAGRVFDARKYVIALKPARRQTALTAADWLNNENRKIIGSEYLKMGWFLIYFLFQ